MKKHLLVFFVALAALATARLVSGPFVSQSLINGAAVSIRQPASATALTVLGTDTSITYLNDLLQTVTNGTNSSGVTYGAWGRPVTLRGNALGDVGTYSIALTVAAGVYNTNTSVWTFERSVDGTYYDANSRWSFTMPAELTGLLDNTLVTNVPAWFVTGAQNLRVYSAVFGTNTTGYTNSVARLRLNSFAP